MYPPEGFDSVYVANPMNRQWRPSLLRMHCSVTRNTRKHQEKDANKYTFKSVIRSSCAPPTSHFQWVASDQLIAADKSHSRIVPVLLTPFCKIHSAFHLWNHLELEAQVTIEETEMDLV